MFSRNIVTILLLLALGLAACRPGPADATPTDAPPPFVTEQPIPAPQVTVDIVTPAPTETPAAPDPTTPSEATAQPEGTQAAPEATATVAAGEQPTAAPGGPDQANFVADVTVPDGSNFSTGAAFVKTWRLTNAGSAAWTTAYALVFVRGDQMGAPAAVPLEASVPAGQSVDISVNLTAPEQFGNYTGFYMLRNAAGALFGIGPEANQPVYVQINVTAAGAGDGGPAPTAVAGAIQVTGATLTVDQAERSGQCPQTFVFGGTLVSEGAGNITYRLMAEADTPGFEFNLPTPNTSTFSGPGPRNFGVSYNMQFAGSVSGRMWIEVTAPNTLESNRVTFSLACEAAP